MHASQGRLRIFGPLFILERTHEPLEEQIPLRRHGLSPFNLFLGVYILGRHFSIRQATQSGDLARVLTRVVIIVWVGLSRTLQIVEYQPQKSSCAVSGGDFDRKKDIEKIERRVKVRSSERLCIIKETTTY